MNLNDPSTGAFRQSPDALNRIDELLVFDNALVGKNKSAAGDYYFRNGAWCKIGQAASKSRRSTWCFSRARVYCFARGQVRAG